MLLNPPHAVQYQKLCSIYNVTFNKMPLVPHFTATVSAHYILPSIYFFIALRTMSSLSTAQSSHDRRVQIAA